MIEKIHHHQLERLLKLKTITRSAWPNTCYHINTELVWYHTFIFNFSVNNEMKAGIPSTFKVQTFHLVTTSTTHQRCKHTMPLLLSATSHSHKIFPKQVPNQKCFKDLKCLKTCSPALMLLLYQHIRGQS